MQPITTELRKVRADLAYGRIKLSPLSLYIAVQSWETVTLNLVEEVPIEI